MNPANTGHPMKSKWGRKLFVRMGVTALGAIGLLIAVVVIWPGQFLNVVLQIAGLDVRIESVDANLVARNMACENVIWTDNDAQLQGSASKLEFVGFALQDGQIILQDLKLENVNLTEISSDDMDTDSVPNPNTSTPEWETIWDGFLKGVAIQHIEWNHVHSAWNDRQSIDLYNGVCEGLKLDNSGIELSPLTWSSATVVAPNFPEAVEIQSSEIQGFWSEHEWHLESTGLNIPGFETKGEISWPNMTGQGELQIDWGLLPVWATDLGLQPWIHDLNLANEKTVISWDLGQDKWAARASGPSWFSLASNGSHESWHLSMNLREVPEKLRNGLPSDSLKLLGSGSQAGCEFTLKGGEKLHIELTSSKPSKWNEWLSSPQLPQKAAFRVVHWEGLIDSEEEVVDGLFQFDTTTAKVTIRQADVSLPWTLNASHSAGNIRINGQIGDPAIPNEKWHLDGAANMKVSEQKANWHASVWGPMFADSILTQGRLEWRNDASPWSAIMNGGGARMTASGRGIPEIPNATDLLQLNLRAYHWPNFQASGEFHPQTGWAALLSEDFILEDTATFHVTSEKSMLESQCFLPKWQLGGTRVISTSFELNGQGDGIDLSLISSIPMENDTNSTSINLQIHGDSKWNAALACVSQKHDSLQIELEATPSIDSDTVWHCAFNRMTIPVAGDHFHLTEGETNWLASFHNPFPHRLVLQGESGEIALTNTSANNKGNAVDVHAEIQSPESWTRQFSSSLHIGSINIDGKLAWRMDSPNDFSALVAARAESIDYEAIHLDDLDASITWNRGQLNVFSKAKNPTSETTLDSRLSWRPFDKNDVPKLDATFTNLPILWAESWVDSSMVHLEGKLQADLHVEGPWDDISIEGGGHVDSVMAFIPSLGTSFGGHGQFLFGKGDLWLNNFSLFDALGNMTRMEGALVHDNFSDWNFDASLVDTPNPLLLMNLPETRDAIAYGQLVVGGSLDLFYWNQQLEIRGDVAAEAQTDLHLSLLTEDSEGWSSTVDFVQPQTMDAAQDESAEGSLDVLIDLDIEAKRQAKFTIVTDPENDANIVGYTEGNLNFMLDDWEHMTLNGELEIVEGQYDFALGPFVRKSFVAKPGGRLFWSGNPFEGSLDLDAVYSTRANVQPLLGNGSTVAQNEDVDVLLRLTGPMMKPNIEFDLSTPNAPPLVSEALSSALTDESEKASQAIALMSLQEFLPPQYNSLQLGATGLQETSVDVVTSQLSQWLSRINDDVDIGIRYDASSLENESLVESQQDALQLALRATFLNDKLEVEGAVGSREISQEALGEAHLQNVRVLYHLNEEKSLQLTGFSEAQTSATQSANTTNQGVGIRWHKSFNWRWPWQKDAAQE